MSGLALLLKRRGGLITASDKNDSPYLKKLSSMGIETWVGSHPEKIHPDAHVFYSSAVKETDAERKYAHSKSMPCHSRHLLLETITADFYTIAIAGCHGKTTTSAWVADLLTRAGFDPTALIGGTVPAWESNFREGKGEINGKPILVIEADESDHSFLSIDVDIALITNIDLDHTDIHANLNSLENEFQEFAIRAKKNNGYIILSHECNRILEKNLSKEEKEIHNSISVDAHLHSVKAQGKNYSVGLPGYHNLMNATAVLGLSLALKISSEITAASLWEFSGVSRRIETLKIFPQFNLTIIDDYAHHPHEVEATLATLDAIYETLWIFWEPHRLSRFVHFHNEFKNVFQPYVKKHTLFTFPIYASGDLWADYPSAETLFTPFKVAPYTHIASNANFKNIFSTADKRKKAAVFMGAGLSSKYAHEFVQFLETQ
ncbi:MAG: UDP-N-acetylmuramate--L-alanine ligase [Turneriella sp.]|nr:UDP-N-acetylmuramate--L-alanine ligase [Turneriella sp.]